MRLIDLGDHSEELHTESDLVGAVFDGTHDCVADGIAFTRLYEAKMTNCYDHRFGTFLGVSADQQSEGKPRDSLDLEHASSEYAVKPRYWISSSFFQSVIIKYGDQKRWLLAYRDIVNTERACLPCAIPLGAATRSLPVVGVAPDTPKWLLLANLGSFAFDYSIRQKVAGKHLTFTILKQAPIIHINTIAHHSMPPLGDLFDFIRMRVLELSYSAWDLEPFGLDCGWSGPPFRWDEERRFLLRCELDAAYFHLYFSADSDGQWRPRGSLRARFATRLLRNLLS